MRKSTLFAIFIAFCAASSLADEYDYTLSASIYNRYTGKYDASVGTVKFNNKKLSETIGSNETFSGTIEASSNNDEYYFLGWVKKQGATHCNIANNSSDETKIEVVGDCQLEAIFDKPIATIIAKEGGSVDKTSITTTSGTRKNIRAYADTEKGYSFYRWRYASNIDKNYCTITDTTSSSTQVQINGHCSIYAVFQIEDWIKIVRDPEEGGSCSRYQIPQFDPCYATEEGCSWNCTANEGYRKDGEGVITSGPCHWEGKYLKRDYTGPCTITYYFIKGGFIDITEGEGGKATPHGMQVDLGTKSSSISAYPNEGYKFSSWTFVSGSSNCKLSSTTDADITVTVNGDCKIKANFTKLTLDVTAGEGGTVSPENKIVSTAGDSVSIKATPKSDYSFSKWTITSGSSNCSIKNATSASTKVKVSGPCTVKANFVRNYSLEITSTDGGNGTPTSTIVTSGSNVEITATPKSGYFFYTWQSLNDNLCPIKDKLSSKTTVTVKNDCIIVAQFIKKIHVTLRIAYPHEIIKNDIVYHYMDSIVYKDTILGQELAHEIALDSLKGYYLSHYKVTKGTCHVFLSDNNKTITLSPREESTITVYLEPKSTWELGYIGDKRHIFDATFLESYYDDNFKETRLSFPTEKDTWYYMSVSYPDIIITRDYGTDPTYSVEPEIMESDITPQVFSPFSKWIKGDGQTHYISMDIYPGRSNYLNMGISLTKCDSTVLVINSEKTGHTDPSDTLQTITTKSIDVTAFPYTGYVFKDWQTLLNPSSTYPAVYTNYTNPPNVGTVVMRGETHILATFDIDTTIQPILKINSVNADNQPEICMGVTVKAQEREGNIPCIADSNFTLYQDGDTMDFRLTYIGEGDTAAYQLCYDTKDTIMDADIHHIKVSTNFAGKYAADSIQQEKPLWHTVLKINELTYDSLPQLCTSVSISFQESDVNIGWLRDSNFTAALSGTDVPFQMTSEQANYRLCFDAVDSLVNRESREIKISTKFKKFYAADSIKWDESMFRDKDVKDSIVISANSAFTRSTDKFSVSVYTQNFADDIYNPFTNVKVKVSCKATGDVESVTASHKKDGLYVAADIKKNEGAVKSGDGILTCAGNDLIVAEYIDPVYNTITPANIKFGDEIENEYQFYTEDFDELDSTEAFGTSFAFRVTALSTNIGKVDTIPVTLFTDQGDSLKVMAIETGKYTSEFKGRATFSFVTNTQDMKDTTLNAMLDMDSMHNRAVIHAQVGNDRSPTGTRDSLVIRYNFIPADSAEIYDKDLDGRADFVRVHFTKPISNETITIDTVFWSAKKAESRSAVAKKARKVEGDTWIEAPLDAPFDYGVTFLDSTAWKYLNISRKTSSSSQHVPLIDKIGAVPTAAVKHPGERNEDDFMEGDKDIPYDTLVVSISEPMTETKKDAWKKAFQLSTDCNSQNKWNLSLKHEPRISSGGKVWRIIVPHEIDMKVGYCLTMHPDAKYIDGEGNAPGIGGVYITGKDGDNYLYKLRAVPAIAGLKGNKEKWVNPKTRVKETIPDTISCIRTETKQPYKAEIFIYDNEGHMVKTFKFTYGNDGEMEDPLYENKDIATYSGFIHWNQRSDDGRRVSTGVYIWKIHFTFEDGHKEEQIIKTGIRRKSSL